MTTVRVHRLETNLVGGTALRLHRLDATVLAANNSLRVHRLEANALGVADPGPDILGLEPYLLVTMEAVAPGSPTGYVWRQVSGPPVTLTVSGALNKNCTYETPGLLSTQNLVFGVKATYSGGTESGEGTANHEVLYSPNRFVRADGTDAAVKLIPVGQPL